MVQKWIDDGKFSKKDNRTFWVFLDNEKRIGLICLYDVNDTLIMYPEFEMWINSAFRVSKILRMIIDSFIDEIFKTFKEAIGLNSQMRQDDVLMRQTLHRCGFVKEGHRRKSWPSEKGMYHDSVEYAILRVDWETKKVTPVDWEDEHFEENHDIVDHNNRQNIDVSRTVFRKFNPDEAEEMAELLSSETWQYHIYTNPGKEQVLQWIKDGKFASEEKQTFWVILNSKDKIGMIRLFGLRDPLPYCPTMDMRIKSQYRGKGIGKIMLVWLTDHIFITMPEKMRIEGYTRQQNTAMRKVFRKCGHAKEGHYRRRNQVQQDLCYDIVAYGITRDDWEQKKVTPVKWYDKKS